MDFTAAESSLRIEAVVVEDRPAGSWGAGSSPVSSLLAEGFLSPRKMLELGGAVLAPEGACLLGRAELLQ